MRILWLVMGFICYGTLCIGAGVAIMAVIASAGYANKCDNCLIKKMLKEFEIKEDD